jgi:hypothetical protein
VNSTSTLISCVVGIAAFAGGWFALNRPAAEQPTEPKRIPEFVKPADAPKPDAKPEPKAEPKPEPKPEPPAPLVLARWAVPVAVLNGKEDRGSNGVKTLAVSNDGERVMVGTAHFIDIWHKGDRAAVRAQLPRVETVFLAPDASRGYIVASDPTRVETYDRDGRKVNSWQPPRPLPGWHARMEFGGFHPVNHKFTISVNCEKTHGFYEFDANGTAALKVPFATSGEVYSCQKLFPQVEGGYLVHYEPNFDEKQPRGLVRVSATGKFAHAPRIPAVKDAKDHFRDIAVSQDGRFAALIQGRTLTVYDARTGAELFSWSKQYYYAAECRFVQNRVVLWAGSDYQMWKSQFGSVMQVSVPPAMLIQFDPVTQKRVSEFVIGETNFGCDYFALSPDGSKLALATEKEVLVLDATRAFRPVK